MKYPPSPTALRWIAGSDVVVGVAFGILAIVRPSGPVAMFDAFMAGAAFAAALHTVLLARASDHASELARLIAMLTTRDSPPISPHDAPPRA